MVEPSAEAPFEIRTLVHGKTLFIEKTLHAISVARFLFVIMIEICLNVKIIFSLVF